MKNISFLIVVLLTFSSYTIAQKKTNLVLGTGVEFYHYYAPQVIYLNMSYQIGAEIEFNKGTLLLSGAYVLNLVNDVQFSKRLSFLGVNVRYRILNNTKIISPTLSVSLFSEVRKKGSAFIDYGSPRLVKSNNGMFVYYNDQYISTPFIGSLSFGFHAFLHKGLSMIVEGGYGFRFVKYLTQEYRDKNIIISTTNHAEYFQSFDFKLSFNYTFSFDKHFNKVSNK